MILDASNSYISIHNYNYISYFSSCDISSGVTQSTCKSLQTALVPQQGDSLVSDWFDHSLVVPRNGHEQVTTSVQRDVILSLVWCRIPFLQMCGKWDWTPLHLLGDWSLEDTQTLLRSLRIRLPAHHVKWVGVLLKARFKSNKKDSYISYLK